MSLTPSQGFCMGHSFDMIQLIPPATLADAVFGFKSAVIEHRYLSHLDSVAFSWFRRLVLITSVLAIAIVTIGTSGDFTLDSFSTFKLAVHLGCIAFALLSNLIPKSSLPYNSGRHGLLLVCLITLAERLYHFLFLLGLIEWTDIAQAFIIVDRSSGIAIFQSAVGPIASSLGIPLTFKSQLLLRIFTEAIEAALMYKVSSVSGLEISIISRVLTRCVLSLLTGLLIEVTRRQAFLKSQSKAVMQTSPIESYSSPLPPIEHVTLKTSPHLGDMPQDEDLHLYYDTSDLANHIKARQPDTYQLYLRVRRGCLVFDTVICSPSNSPPVDILDLISKLHPESEASSFESPMMLRAYVTGPDGTTSCLFAHDEGEWRKVEEDAKPYESILAFDPVICNPVDARSTRLVGVWKGPPPPHGSQVEAVYHGQLIKTTCFPDPSIWTDGSEVKLTLFLDDLKSPLDGGMLNINLWSPPPNRMAGPSLPQVMVASSNILLLPAGSEGAVEELMHVFKESGGTASKPWGNLNELAQDISHVLWAASSNKSSLDPKVVSKFQCAARAVIQWASGSDCPSIKRMITKALKNIWQRGSFVTSLQAPFKTYRPNPAWTLIFGSALALSIIKGLATTDGSLVRDIAMERMINLTALPYFVCILAQIVAGVASSTSLGKRARLFLDYAGIFLPISRALIGFAFLSPHFALGLTKNSMPAPDSGVGLGLWYKWEYSFGEWLTYLATCLVSKILFALFEPTDLRAFIPIALGLEAPILTGMLYFKIQCSLFFSVAFGILSYVFCIIVGVLFRRKLASSSESAMTKKVRVKKHV